MDFKGFTKKQRRVINEIQIRPYSILTGAVRAGKTVSVEFGCLPLIKEHLNNNIVFVGKTVNTIDRNMFQDMRELFGSNITQVSSDNKIYIFGKMCYVVGANDDRAVTKIQGMSIGLAIGDEITTWPRNFWEMLKTRLDKHNSKFIGTCNPEGPSHFVKQFIDANESSKDIFVEHFNILDNPTLPKDYVDRMINLFKGTIYYDRWVLGKWVSTDGLVFPMFKRERHYLTSQEYSNRFGWKRITHIIFGTDGATTKDATAIVPLAIFEDGTAAVLEIFHHNPKISEPLSNERLMHLIAKYFQDLDMKYKLFENNVNFAMPVDCASSDLTLTLFYHFPQFNPLSFTKKNLIDTTQAVNSALGRNIITILNMGGTMNYSRNQFETGVNTLVIELESMIWDDKRENKFDDSIPNDVADGFRYGVAFWYQNPDNLWKTPDSYKFVT